jgi:SPP1 family predicted phage head-tail adaptor
MSFDGLLDSYVKIIRQTQTTDGQGGWTTADTVLYQRVKCRFEATMGRQEAGIYGTTVVMPDFYVYLNYTSGIKEGDRLVDKNSKQFEIKLIDDWSKQQKYMRLAVSEIGRNET